MRCRSCSVLALAAFVAACQPEPPPMSAEANIETDRQAILDLERGLFAAEAAGDLDAWMDFIDDDPVLLPPNEPAMTDRRAWRFTL